MHEKHIVEDLIQAITQRAEKEKAVRVTKISVWLGALSHMPPSHFREHFELAAQGSIAENAAIAIETSDDIYDPHANRILLRSIEIS